LPKAPSLTTVSAIVVTRHPSQRVVELLRTVRPVVDEIVVAVDDRAGEEGLGALEELADAVALFRFEHSIEKQWEWIAGLSTSAWTLWLDDDELPSRALLGALPGLVRATDVTHYLLRRTWLWPDAGAALAEPPWAPDFSPRLYRGDPALVWYPGRLHVPVKQLGPFRLVEEPLYHVDLVQNSVESRRAKADRYERLRPGLRAAGRPQNEAVYLPESRPKQPTTTPVPAGDRATIERFLATPDEAIVDSPATRPVLRGTAETVAAAYRGEADDGHDDATVEIVGSMEPTYAGVERSVEVRVANRGLHWWPPTTFQVSDLYVSYRWYAADGSVAVDGGLRTPLPVGVAPGASELVLLDVIPPLAAGRYSLGVDLVREHVRWFGCEQRLEVEVRRVPTVGILVDADEPSLATAAAVSLTAAVPEAELTLLARDPGSTHAATGYPAQGDPTLAALGEGTVQLLLAATRASGRRALDGRVPDVVVVAGTARLSGSAGRREALALAAVIRGLARAGVRMVALGDAEPGQRDPAGRLAARALSLVERRVDPGEDEPLAAAVRELLATGPSRHGA
jgi:hypothetical protein